MKKLKLFGLLTSVLLTGAFLGGWLGVRLSSRVYDRMRYARHEGDFAFIAAQEAEWLAALRLSKTNDAILSLENALNISVGTLAAWNETSPPDEKDREARDRWLIAVKIYRESYPTSGEDTASINALLSSVPGRSSNSICNSNIYLLDDRRLAQLHPITNSP